jgi:GH15 family glucan-1,4-alpha-glucosidase
VTRPLLLSNGRLHVGINLFGLVHDLYYPYVGFENHARANKLRQRIGVWAEGEFSWLDDGSWDFHMDYAYHAQIGHITARNEHLGITLELLDCVTRDEDAFLRNIHIMNTTKRQREVRLFMQQVFIISSTFNGDTAQYLPGDEAILHFKGRRNFVAGGVDQNGNSFNQHTMGVFGVDGKDGSYRDAEDGVLQTNQVDFGRVDSVLGFTLHIPRLESAHVRYWLAAGRSQWDAIDLHRKIKKVGFDPFFEQVAQHWHRWLRPLDDITKKLNGGLAAATWRSMLVLNSQIDHKGGVIASTDTSMLNYRRDSYVYCWPRDGGYTIWPLIRLGYKTEPKRFFDFCTRSLHPDGFLLQKYRPDAAMGSTWHPYVFGDRIIPPIQEDETALVVFLLGEFFEKTKDKQLLAEFYEPLVVPTANFMASYIDETTKLPHPSYDLWEEKFLTSTYTVALTYAALQAAAKMAEKMGKPKDAVRWQTVADEFPAAATKLLFNKQRGYFYKGFINEGEKGLHYDETVDTSSFYGAFMFGLFPLDSKLITTAHKTLETVFHLEPQEPTIIQRYERDQYFTFDSAGMGNPWFVTTLWLAEYDLQTGNTERGKMTIEWVKDQMMTTGVLSEQINPHSLEFTSVAPLTWSQAEFVSSILDLVAHDKPQEPDDGSS